MAYSALQLSSLPQAVPHRNATLMPLAGMADVVEAFVATAAQLVSTGYGLVRWWVDDLGVQRLMLVGLGSDGGVFDVSWTPDASSP